MSWPSRQRATIDLARVAEMPCQLHNNCSGKHAGFLCTCVHAGIDRQGYVAASHPMQELVREAMEDVTGAPHSAAMRGTDGCSIPTYAVPLRSLARGFARMTTGDGLKPQRAASARRILAACMAEPFLIAGTRRSDTRMMEAGKGRVFTKMGAEGVFCAALPEAGLGIALKCDDGAGRAADVMIAETIARLLGARDDLAPVFRDMARPELRNWKGLPVASLRPTEALERASE